jgi:hypothetical protein
MPFQSDIVVKSQSQGPPGSIGVSGIISLTNSFTLPANAAEVSVTPASNSIDSLLDGQSYYGLLPGTTANVAVKIRKTGTQYFLKSLFKLSDPVAFPANTSLFVSGDQMLLAIAADVTIAVSGPTAIQLEPNPFVVGARALVAASSTSGVIERTIGGTFFTPANLDAPLALTAFVDFVVLGVRAGSNPTLIGKAELSESGKTFSVGGAIDAIKIGLLKFNIGDKFSGWVFSFRDKLDQIGFGLRTNGSLYLHGFQLGDKFKLDLKDKFSGYVLSIKDLQGRIAFSIKYGGSVTANILSTKSFTLSSFKFVEEIRFHTKNIFSLSDKQGKTAIALRKTGALYANKLETNSIADNGALDPFLTSKLTTSNFLRYLAVRTVQIVILSMNGQSNSTGADGIRDNTSSGFQGYIDTTQIYGNYKLVDTGSAPLYDGTGDVLAFAPLIEPIKPVTGGQLGTLAYPANIDGQTQASPIANEFSQKMPGFVSAISVTGQAGQSFSVICKGGSGNAWAKMLYEVTALKNLAIAASKTYKVGPHFLIHGENDATNTGYKANLLQYVVDLQTDLKPISGQPEDVPLILSQQNSFPFDLSGECLSSQYQFEVARDHPLIYLAAPTYQYKFLPQASPNSGSGVHRDAWSVRREGIKLNQVATLVWAFGLEWTGLVPRSISAFKNRIRIQLYVPFGPLRLDPNIVQPDTMNGSPNPWVAGKGFEVADASNNPIPINGVYIVANNEIEIVIPNGYTAAQVRYAWAINYVPSGIAPYPTVCPAGRDTGRRGSLCDSDPYQGYDRQVISCGVTNGSASITTTSNGFLNVGWYDRVHGSGFADPTIVKTRISDNSFTLSSPWTGTTGTVPLIFHSDQSNYCAAFNLPIGYSGV